MSWDRAAAPAATVLLPTSLVLLFFGGPYGVVGVAGAALTLGALVLVLRPRRVRRLDLEWVALPAPIAASAQPARGSIARALGPVEIRELLLSPWLAVGLAFCVIFGTLGVESFERSWWVTAALMPLLVHPLCGMTIIASHRNVTRARRDHAEELFESCPASSGQRTFGHLLTASVPVLAASLFVVATLLGVRIFEPDIYGPVDARVYADAALAAVILPAGAVALGIFLGRRARFALAPFVAIGLIALLDLEMWDRGLDGRGWLATGIASGGVDFIYVDPPVIGRLAWMTGLVILTAGLALVATGWSGTRLVISIGLAASAVGLVLTVRPMSDETADRLAEYVIAPFDHEICQRVSADVEACALEPYAEQGANVAARIAPVAAAIPEGTVDTPITMRMLAGEHLDELPSRVQQRIVPTPIPAGTIAMPFTHHEGTLESSRFVLAAHALGIATGDDAPENLLVDGQARGVVLLWLATAGLSVDAAQDLLQPDQYNEDSPSGRGHVWPAGCAAPVQWAPQDVAAARALVALDRATVAGVVAEQWDRWLAPETTTDELLLAVGIPSMGPSDEIHPLGSPC